MVRTDNYTSELLRIAKTVSVLNAERGIYQADGFAAVVAQDSLPRCECDGFKADGECIHLDAIGYLLDYGPIQA